MDGLDPTWVQNFLRFVCLRSIRVTAVVSTCGFCRRRQSYGHAMIIDPWGEVIAKLDDPHVTGIAVAQLDMERLDEVRSKMPIWTHRAAARELCEDKNK